MRTSADGVSRNTCNMGSPPDCFWKSLEWDLVLNVPHVLVLLSPFVIYALCPKFFLQQQLSLFCIMLHWVVWKQRMMRIGDYNCLSDVHSLVVKADCGTLRLVDDNPAVCNSWCLPLCQLTNVIRQCMSGIVQQLNWFTEPSVQLGVCADSITLAEVCRSTHCHFWTTEDMEICCSFKQI